MLKAVNGCHQTLVRSRSPLSSAGTAQAARVSHFSLLSFQILLRLALVWHHSLAFSNKFDGVVKTHHPTERETP